jgi:hypothetical protein
MKITAVRLLIPRDSSYFNNGEISGNIRNRGWVSRTRVANPMSIYPAYAEERVSWMGPGQEHYAIEIETDSGQVGVCANYYGGPLACQIIHSHFRRFLIGADPFDTELLWQQMYRASVPYGLGALTGMAIAGVDIALWEPPAAPSGKALRTVIGGTGLAVSARCPAADIAVDFASFVASGSVQRTLYTQAGGQPGHLSAWTDALNNQLTGNFFNRTLPAMQRAWTRPRFEGFLAFQEKAGLPVQEWIQSGGSTRNCLKAVNELWQQSWRRQTHQ